MTLLSILADLNNAVAWMVSTRPLISKFSSFFINTLVTVPRASIIICINVTFMFHSCFFNYLTRSTNLFFFFFFFLLILLYGKSEQQRPQFCKFSFFFLLLLIIIRSGYLAEIKWSVCMSKSHRSLCFSFSKTDVGLCICDNTSSVPRYVNFFKPFHFLAGDQLVVPIGASHISSWQQEIQSRELEEREQTNKRTICLGKFKVQEEELCNIAFPMCICRLTLAWISSEISTKLLGMPTHLDRFSLTALDSLSCQLVTSLLSSVDWPLVSPFANRLLWVLLSNSYWPSLAYFRSRRDLESKPFVWFCAQTDKGIVGLADHLHRVTHI